MQSLTQLLGDYLDLGGKRKLEAVTAYLTPELKQILEEWAAEESRSLSRHIAHLLVQAAKEYRAEDKDSGLERQK